MNNEPIVITRTQIGRAASVVGGVSLVVAAALIAMLGLVTAAGLVALIVAIAGLSLWIVLAPDDFRDWVTGRQARYGSGSILGTLLFAGIVLLIYGFVAGRGVVLDMTLPQNFTLSAPTRDILRQLDRPVQLTGFYSSATIATREQNNIVYQLFQAESEGRFRVVYIDPNAEPTQAARFNASDGLAFLTFVDPATGQPDLTRVETINPNEAQERGVANALLRLLAAGRFKIYFTSGHGELDPLDTSRDGLSGIFARSADQGIQTETLDLLTVEEIPADASALLIVGAQGRFTEAEVEMIAAYLDRGGSLFVAAEPRLRPEITFLDADDPLRVLLADRFGLDVLDDLIVDDASSFQNGTNVVASSLSYHAIMENLGDTLSIVFLGTRSINVLPYEEQPESMSRSGRAPLALTSPTAYAESDLQTFWSGGAYAQDDADLTGELPIAAVAQDVETNARIMVTGDADFLRNEPAGYSGNLIFYDQAVGWLTSFTEEVEIDPMTDPTRLPLAIQDSTLSAIFVVTVIVLPGLVLLAGLVVWNRRRRR